MRELTRSVMALIVPPLPAPSRPSKTMQTLNPLCNTHCWSLTNSTCRRANSRSYSFPFSLPLASGSSLSASVIESSFAPPTIRSLLKHCAKCALLPGQNEADIAGHASRILEHFSLEMEVERPELITPEFVSEFGAAFQRRFPAGLRVVDPAAAIAAQLIWKTINLHLALSAIRRMADQLHHDLHQLVGRPVERFVQFLHHCLLLFLLVLHMPQVFGGLRRLALGYSVFDISS